MPTEKEAFLERVLATMIAEIRSGTGDKSWTPESASLEHMQWFAEAMNNACVVCDNVEQMIDPEVKFEGIPALVGLIGDLLPAMTKQERLDFFSAVTSDYCTECGRDDPTCQCWNDD
jgi:hypothetical protein